MPSMETKLFRIAIFSLDRFEAEGIRRNPINGNGRNLTWIP